MTVSASTYLNTLNDDPITLGAAIKNIRLTEYDNMSQQDFAEKVLNISKTRLSDLENNRKPTSIKKAIDLAHKMGQSKRYFVLLVMQDMLRENHLAYQIALTG